MPSPSPTFDSPPFSPLTHQQVALRHHDRAAERRPWLCGQPPIALPQPSEGSLCCCLWRRRRRRWRRKASPRRQREMGGRWRGAGGWGRRGQGRQGRREASRQREHQWCCRCARGQHAALVWRHVLEEDGSHERSLLTRWIWIRVGRSHRLPSTWNTSSADTFGPLA